MRVLVVKMSSLGDVIHTLPALTDAARALPGIRFDWVVEEAFAEIPGWHPAVDRVIPVALRRWRKRPLQALRGPEWKQARQALRLRQYDAVIDAQGLLKSAFIAGQVKAPRHGMDRQTVREGLAAAVYHHRIHVPRDMHAIERIRLLFSRALHYRPFSDPGDYGLRAALSHLAYSLPPGLLLFHGTARPGKLWPRERWVEFGELATGAGYRLWLPWGNQQEQERAHWIAGQLPRAEVLPRLDLQELAGMLLAVRGAVAVDTGLGHLSAALAVPTVSLYGPTSTRLVGAYGHDQVHIQSPLGVADTADSRAMMRSIRAPAVWQALQAILPGVD